MRFVFVKKGKGGSTTRARETMLLFDKKKGTNLSNEPM